MLSLDQIRKQLQEYLAQRISLDQFEDWLVSASWNMHKHADKDAQHLVGAIELRLAEYSRGHLGDSELKYELGMILAYGYKLPAARMLVISPISELRTNTNSSSNLEERPFAQTVIIAGNYVASSDTRTGSGRTVTARELLQKVS
ncbi:MAG: hypothetical protein HY648_10490 [Acidobacteria bacterium]|nr:hypothetical protein [Acidobacteriota bacterium]